MPDAFPQLARCFEAQWRGLTDEERKWAMHPSVMRIDHIVQKVEPLWTVEHQWGAIVVPIFVLSFKDDLLL